MLQATLLCTTAKADPLEPTYIVPVRTALEACFELPQGRNQLTAVMADAGWTSDDNAPMQTLVSYLLLSQWDHSIDPFILVGGAIFMAAQMLDSSAMKTAPSGFSIGETSVSVVDIKNFNNSSPFCVLTGPKELKDVVIAQINVPELEMNEAQRHAEWEIDRKVVSLVFWEPNDLRKTLEFVPNELEAEPIYRPRPTNLMISQLPE